jgi:hypothetical protein
MELLPMIIYESTKRIGVFSTNTVAADMLGMIFAKLGFLHTDNPPRIPSELNEKYSYLYGKVLNNIRRSCPDKLFTAIGDLRWGDDVETMEFIMRFERFLIDCGGYAVMQ